MTSAGGYGREISVAPGANGDFDWNGIVRTVIGRGLAYRAESEGLAHGGWIGWGVCQVSCYRCTQRD